MGRETVRKYHLAAVLLLVCLFAQTVVHARVASITFDEGPHLAIGYATLRTGDFRLQPVHIHPPLANVLSALPLLALPDLPDPRTVSGWGGASLSGVTDAVVWQYPHPLRMAMAGRFPIILMTVLLGAVVFRWATDLFGPRAGLVALTLFAFDPSVIAHGSLVTTDMAVVLWGTMALFFLTRQLRSARWGYWAGTAVTLGLALASKVSAVSLAPVIGLLWLLGPPRASWRRRLLAAAGGLALAGMVLWAAYGFEVRSVPGFPLPLPAATHLEIYRSLQEHYRLGHPSFLLGQNADHGWWYYFPVAFALKTPLPTLLLLLAAIVVFGLRVSRAAERAIRRSQPSICSPLFGTHRWGPLLLFPILYAASALFSSVTIGYRHLLPILPLLYIFIAQIAAPSVRWRASPLTSRLLLLACCATVVWQVAGTLSVSPHYLAYFNPLAGGPDGGYRYLVDSNLDWGQNLWQLRDWAQEQGVQRVYYAHFTPARPQLFGVEADFLPPDPRAVPFAPLDPAPGVYAIGATVLQGVYTPDVNTYAWFRSHEPLARLGHALFLYEVEARDAPAWAVICTDPAPVLSRGALREGLGQPDLRVILADCRQSWVVAAGGEPGEYVLPPDAAPPPGATLEVQARHADGSPSHLLYRLDAPALAPGQMVDGQTVQSAGAVTMDGPLRPLGYWLRRPEARPGEAVELWTLWEVAEVPDRLLSLMAHMVGPEGSPVAVGDGLGVPIEEWRPGDVIAQRHLLVVPEGTSPGEYLLQTGAYWLDTMERWTVRQEGGGTTDRMILTAVEVPE